MLEDYLCLHQTKLDVLSQKGLTVSGQCKESFGNTNIYRGSYINRYKAGKTANTVKRGII